MKKIVIPSNIDIDRIIFESNNEYFNSKESKYVKYDFDLKELKKETIHYFIYYILYHTISNLNVKQEKERETYVKDGRIIYNDIYINLSSTFLQQIDRNYNKIMRFLTNQHFNNDNILFRKRYNNGSSFSYCLNLHLFDTKFKILDISQKSIIKHINTDCSTSINNSIINRKYRSLKNDFINKIFIDFNKIPNEVSKDKIISDYSAIFNLINYSNGKKRMSLNDLTDGRLHTNFTNLSSKFRSAITNYSGDKLVEIDIGASIPYLFICSLIHGSKLNFEIDNNINLVNFQSLFDEIMDKIKECGFYESLKKELSIFYKKIITDEIYSYFIGDFNLTKRDLLSVFFCKNNSKINIENRLKQLFPIIYFCLHTIKDNLFWSKKIGTIPYVDCNEILSHYLFHLESYLILNKVVNEIKKQIKGNIEIITIHDCVMVSEKHSSQVKEIMSNVIKDYLGLYPNIKIKKI